MKKMLTIIMAVCILCLSVPSFTQAAEAPSQTQSTVSVAELDAYLKSNMGVLTTDFGTFDFSNNIRLVENTNQNKCFDIAVVIDWDAFESAYYNVMWNVNYTDEQKQAFKDSVNEYQYCIAAVVTGIMPTKKVRGGFLDYGYKYPHIRVDYYEGAPFGWKNYGYSTDIMPGYNGTIISEFSWDGFNSVGHPYDLIF